MAVSLVGRQPPRMRGYVGGQHLYPSARRAARPRVPKSVGPSITARGPRQPVTPGAPGTVPTIPGVTASPAVAPVSPYVPMIGGDWEVQQLQGTGEAQLERARGGFRQSIRQALIDMGVVDPSRLGNLGQWIDQETITKAAQNKYSKTAQIAQREELQRRSGEAALAARGILSSGQTTTEAERRLAEAEGSRYDALRTFLGAGEQGLTGLADLESDIANQLAMARFNAAQRAADTYGMGLGGGTPEDMAAAPGAGVAKAPARYYAPALTRQAFRQQRPQGNYQNYISYLARNRPGWNPRKPSIKQPKPARR